jgi:hypothetical protein
MLKYHINGLDLNIPFIDKYDNETTWLDQGLLKSHPIMIRYLINSGAKVCNFEYNVNNTKTLDFMITKLSDQRDNIIESTIGNAVQQRMWNVVPDHLFKRYFNNIAPRIDEYTRMFIMSHSVKPLSSLVRHGIIISLQTMVYILAVICKHDNKGDLIKKILKKYSFSTTQLNQILFNATYTQFDYLQMIINAGADVNCKIFVDAQNGERTSLANAVQYASYGIIGTLLRNGAKIDPKDTNLVYRLCAKYYTNLPVIKYFESQVEMNQDFINEILELVYREANKELVSYFLEKYTFDIKVKSTIYVKYSIHNEHVVKLFLHKGVNPNHHNNVGLTNAIKSRYPNVLELLIRWSNRICNKQKLIRSIKRILKTESDDSLIREFTYCLHLLEFK